MLLESLDLKLINFFWTEFSEFKFSSPSSLSYKVDELINNIWGILINLKFGLVCEKISKKHWIFDEFNVLFLNCKNKMTFSDFWMIFLKIYNTFVCLTSFDSNSIQHNKNKHKIVRRSVLINSVWIFFCFQIFNFGIHAQVSGGPYKNNNS